MKTKFYLLLFLTVGFSVNMQAQLLPDFKTMLIEEWKNNSWRNDTRTTSDYDSQGHLIKQTNEYWDTLTSKWKEDVIIDYSLNADGTIKEMTMKAWDEDLNQMVVASKTIYTYTAEKKTATSTMQMDIGLGLMDLEKTTYTYNAGGQLEKEVSQSLNFMSLELENSMQTLYEYNPDGTEHRSVIQTFNDTSGAWEDEIRNTHTYMSTKKVEKTLAESFTGGTWVKNSQTSYSYNADDSFKEIVEEIWEATSQKWIFDWKEIFTYSNGIMQQLLEQEWNTPLARWDNSYRITFGYTTTGTEDQITWASGDLRVYPNPFNDRLHIESQTIGESFIEIFNPEGKLIYSALRKGDKISVDTGDFQDGMYLLRLRTGDAVRTTKILKQR